VILLAWQPLRLTTEQREERRLEVARLLKLGWSQVEICREVGASPAAVSGWARTLREKGLGGLKHKPHLGRKSKLTKTQWQELRQLLKRGARAAGFPTERWTLARAAAFIKQRFGVEYNANYLAEPLHRLGFSPQHPMTQARERNEELVQAWLRQDWPRIKRGLENAVQ
jgi:transposase